MFGAGVDDLSIEVISVERLNDSITQDRHRRMSQVVFLAGSHKRTLPRVRSSGYATMASSFTLRQVALFELSDGAICLNARRDPMLIRHVLFFM